MIKDRLKEFIEYLGVGQNKFEASVGIANGYISSKSITMASDVIAKIKTSHPELNLDWLILGVGDMIKKENKEAEGKDVISGVALDILKNQSETILSQQQTIATLVAKK